MSSQVVDVATLIARGYTPSGRLPGGRVSLMLFWPWATIFACLGAVGLMAGSLTWLYRLVQLFLVANLPFLS